MKMSTIFGIALLMLAVPTISAYTEDFAQDYSFDYATAVNFDPLQPGHELRLDPGNALDEFDAVKTSKPGDNAKFTALAAFNSIDYTFSSEFWNVPTGVTDPLPFGEGCDIMFGEVTWNNAWHPEAAEVYLTDAYVDYGDGNGPVPYVPPAGSKEEGKGYFAGIIWNKVGIQQLSATTRETVEGSFASRFSQNTYYVNTNGIAYSRIHLPSEVVYATGVRLVDITDSVHALAGNTRALTYTVGGASDNGVSLIYDSTDGSVDEVEPPTGGNTDGYDLDAIRVWVMDGEIQELYSICGYKYFADTGTGLEGWTIYLDKYDVAEGTWDNNFAPCLTAPDGSYCFTELEAGIYRVREELQNGWTQVKVEGDAATNFVVLTSGSEGNNFYNTYTCSSDETAWTSGTRYVTQGNWATYTPYEGVAQTVDIYAGQNIYIGYATFSAPVDGQVTITINMNTGATFSDVMDNLKIQGYKTVPPAKNPAPGKFTTYKGTFSGSSATVTVPQYAYYGIHQDVKVPCQ